ncbi:MAG: methylmalonyl Co-A mutase-associated GTPase MeaB [Bacteroidetes bacterium]|nr:methylmalonyl Co-A mutase-associated GTPase MeaB [bacterium]NBP64255.1 methylmalonyl Co-A mutase-associated GTPase MeaB [Bacteroidota bacterium]
MVDPSEIDTHYPMQALIQDIQSGNRRALSKAISMAESSLESDRNATEELLHALIDQTGKAKRIGITGSPGVGKSTFIETFGLSCIEQGERIAVLAIDPSSQSHGGSILGDKVRMPLLARSEHAYIRPSPSRLTLGGVSNATREAVLLCEAAGFSTIIIETVGVGQSEVEVRSITDVFLLLMLPNAGDEIQGIKRGIMELSDIIFINKADGDLLPLAELAASQVRSALTLMHSPTTNWNVPVLTGSGLHKQGIQELLSKCTAFFDANSEHYHSILERREQQTQEWFELALHRELIIWAEQQQSWNTAKQQILQTIHNNQIVPSIAARTLIQTLFKH